MALPALFLLFFQVFIIRWRLLSIGKKDMKEKKTKKAVPSWFILLIILAVAGFFRFVGLDQIPPGINVDESAIGYNAYLIKEAGIDEWGKKYPTVFLSYGDSKPPGLIYVVALLLNFFPPSAMVVRLPSAIAGFLAIIGAYFLVKEFFPKDKLLPLLGAAIFAFSPVFFQVSRFFYESNVANTFFIFGLLFLLRSINEKKIPKGNKNIILAIIFLGLSGYFYIAHRVISLAIFFLTILFFLLKKSISFKKCCLLALLYLLLSLPIFWQFFTGSGLKRLGQEGELINFGAELTINERRGLCYLSSNKNPIVTKACYLFWNKPLLRIQNTAASFLKHFSIDFLFIEGTNSVDRSVSGYGPFLFIFVPFYLVGLFLLVWQSINNRRKLALLVLAGTVIASLPSVVSSQPTEHRALPFFIFIFLIILLGLKFFFSLFEKKGKFLVLLALILIFLFSTTRYLTDYFLIHTKNNDSLFRPDIPVVMAYIAEREQNYDRVLFNDYREDALLALAFLNQFDPTYFLQNVKRSDPNQYGWTFPIKLGKYERGNFDINQLLTDYDSKEDGRILLVTTPLSQKNYYQAASLRIFDRHQIHCLTEIYDIGELKKTLEKE